MAIRAQSKTILLNAIDSVSIHVYSPADFIASGFKENGVLIPSIQQYGISRVYQLKDGQFAIEFYNKVGVLLDSKASFDKLQDVKFERLFHTSRSNEIAWRVEIKEAVFNEMLEKANLLEIPDVLSFFGTFYELESGHVLARWKFWEGKYAILENIRTMIGIDSELRPYLDKEKIDNRKKKIDGRLQRYIENKGNEFINDKDKKLDIEKARDFLTRILNIDQLDLNFTLDSIDRIEEAITWNIEFINNKENYWYLILPVSYYLGEILEREKEVTWQFFSDCEYYGLINVKEEKIDIISEINDCFLALTEYDVVFLKEKFTSIMEKV